MDFFDAYKTELQDKLIEKGWQRWDGDMWCRMNDKSRSFNWKYLVIHMFLGKTPRRKLKKKSKN